MSEIPEHLSLVILGASGDLSRRKIFPALFALFARGMIPKSVRMYGFARSAMTDEAFRASIAEFLQCEEMDEGSCSLAQGEFLARCYYQQGQYGDADAFLNLDRRMSADEGDAPCNRLFYFAIPPSVFLETSRALGAAGLVRGHDDEPWSRVVIEKPFGRDRGSSDHLTRELSAVFSELQTFRIDHYLGKEVIQNLLVLRFANTIFEPIWNREYVSHVHILWKEDLDLSGRAGYFDQFGIIRDVMQNHLTQMLALIGMEEPWHRGARCVRDEKVRLLRQIPPIALEDLVVGQYRRTQTPEGVVAGYREDTAVPDDSITPTFAAAVLKVNSPRWRGVPFLMSAGKGLDASMTEIQIHFKDVENELFGDGAPPPANKLVIRVQPDEDIYFTICNKVPGVGMALDTPKLDLRYRTAYTHRIADAYESLLMDVLRGDRSLFIRADELEAAWDLFTPALHALESGRVTPEPYDFGSTGPVSFDRLAARYDVEDARLRHGQGWWGMPNV